MHIIYWYLFYSILIFTFSMAKGHASGLIRSLTPNQHGQRPCITLFLPGSYPKHGQRPWITLQMVPISLRFQQMAKMAIWGNHLRRGSTSFHSVDEYE